MRRKTSLAEDLPKMTYKKWRRHTIRAQTDTRKI